LLLICSHCKAQYEKFYHAKVKSLDETFSDIVRKVPQNGVLYAIIEIKNSTISYSFFGNQSLMTPEMKIFLDTIKSNWNKKSIAGNKLLLPIYMSLQTDNITPSISMDELIRTNIPPGKYVILEHLGVYNIVHH
jgi:hypothetical protein